ncbi:MAG: hypothetical protein EBT78_14120 [Betaproteobacteria bacterium]|nr:hypothetical protein [Betaproteobacteria bacterium]NBT68883.1 hypothetical protein [Betaproteobacteria bacterium]
MSFSIKTQIEEDIYGVAISGQAIDILPNSNAFNPKQYPFITINAERANPELITSFSGVWDWKVQILYVARADITSRNIFDNNFQKILELLYTTDGLASDLTAYSPSLKYYIASVSSVTPTIKSKTRTWEKSIILDVKCTTIN